MTISTTIPPSTSDGKRVDCHSSSRMDLHPSRPFPSIAACPKIHGNSMRIGLKLLSAGVLAGVLDIIFATLLTLARGRSPEHMLQAVASGLLGKSAFAAGMASAALGLACHLLISIAMAATFFAVGRRWKYALTHLDQSVIAFGILSWALMQYVVVPLSAAPFVLPNTSVSIGTSLFSHILLVGLPIGLIARLAILTPATGPQSRLGA
jgi:hypothetical protein